MGRVEVIITMLAVIITGILDETDCDDTDTAEKKNKKKNTAEKKSYR